MPAFFSAVGYFYISMFLHTDFKNKVEKTAWTFPVQLLWGGTRNPWAHINLSLNTFYFLRVLSLLSFIMLNFTLCLVSQLYSAKT